MEVRIRVDGTRDDVLEFEVHNGGEGIASELRDVLFEPFRSSDRSRGLGFGLFICKQVVMAHGGTIGFEFERRLGDMLPNIASALHHVWNGGG